MTLAVKVALKANTTNQFFDLQKIQRYRKEGAERERERERDVIRIGKKKYHLVRFYMYMYTAYCETLLSLIPIHVSCSAIPHMIAYIVLHKNDMLTSRSILTFSRSGSLNHFTDRNPSDIFFSKTHFYWLDLMMSSKRKRMGYSINR